MNMESKGSSAELASSLREGLLPKWCKGFAEASPTGRSDEKVRNLLRQLGYRNSTSEDEAALRGVKEPVTHTQCQLLSSKLVNIDHSSTSTVTAKCLSDITKNLALSLLKTAKNALLTESVTKLITHASLDMMTYIVLPVLINGSVMSPISKMGKIKIETSPASPLKANDNHVGGTKLKAKQVQPATEEVKEPAPIQVKLKNKVPPEVTKLTKKAKVGIEKSNQTEEERCLAAVLKKFPAPGGDVAGFVFGNHFNCVHPKKPSHWNSIMAVQGPVIADTKYDGERLLIHRKGPGDYTFFSRNRFVVPAKKVNGLFPVIDQALKKFSSCVIDSEIISEYTHGGAVGGIDKSTLVDKPLLFPFDIVYLGGVCIAHVPLRIRKILLLQLLTPVPDGQIRLGDFTPVSGTATQKRDVLMHRMDTLIKGHMEGLVVKPADSPYTFGSKTLWIKLKRGYLDYTDKLPPIPAQECCKVYKEFMEGESERLFGEQEESSAQNSSFLSPPSFQKFGNLPDTIDCAVLGCRFPETGDQSMPETLLVGLWDNKKGRFCTICYAPMTHLSSSKAALLWERVRKNLIRVDRKKTKIPKHLAVHDSNLPDMCISSAKQCVVVEIDGERFKESWEHTCDFITIISPHIIKMREDKDLDTLTSLKDLITMYSESPANKPEMNPNMQCDDVGGSAPSPSQLALLKPAVARQLTTLTTNTSPPTTRILAASVAVVGRWSTKGIMKSINTLFGPSVQKTYEQATPKAKLGDIHVVKVNKPNQSEVYVCLMLCQKYTTGNAVIPKVDITSWEIAVRRLYRFCKEHRKVEIHLAAAAPPVPNANWDIMKDVVERYLLSKDIPVIKYQPSDLGV
eukprot:TRINITY_DN17920_c0_g1_i1.p1 TRINITY_DN17920_c0_g1~~TRINITY_DN17920_c0_g1_i1.p1  ORF type:complete len:852 (+),score=138.35 TRINITY_DN17920_c0_g1_i1:41-2596(+)